MDQHASQGDDDARWNQQDDSPDDLVRWHYRTNSCLRGRHGWCYGREWTPETELVHCTCYCHFPRKLRWSIT